MQELAADADHFPTKKRKSNSNRRKGNRTVSVKCYRPPPELEAPFGYEVIQALTPRQKPLPKHEVYRRTPWGDALKKYAMTYYADWSEIAELISTIHPWCVGTTAKQVRRWAEYGDMPSVPQFMAICFITGVKNPWKLLPEGTKQQGIKKAAATLKKWQYLRFLQDKSMVKEKPDLESLV